MRAFLSPCRVLAAVLLGIMVSPSGAAGRPTSEASVKAGFIYNFTRFVTWPAAAFSGRKAPFVIGVGGSGQLGGVLSEATESRAVGTRSIVIRQIGSGPQPGELRGCHILVFDDVARRRAAELFSSLRGASVLTVGSAEGFAKRGGAIGFRRDGRRLALDLSLEAVAEANLRVSAQLKQISRLVEREH